VTADLPWVAVAGIGLGLLAVALLYRIAGRLEAILTELADVRRAISGPSLSSQSIGGRLDDLAAGIGPLTEAVEDIRSRMKTVEGAALDRYERDPN
jgi:hypothetical protein